jgi:hypothetical protein
MFCFALEAKDFYRPRRKINSGQTNNDNGSIILADSLCEEVVNRN